MKNISKLLTGTATSRTALDFISRAEEAWQKRRYPAHFISKLSDADGEQAETQHWIATATASAYITREQQEKLMEQCLRIGQMLGNMMSNPDQWCH